MKVWLLEQLIDEFEGTWDPIGIFSSLEKAQAEAQGWNCETELSSWELDGALIESQIDPQPPKEKVQ